MIRIEADAIQSAEHDMLSAPIRLITNQSKIRVTLKRRVSLKHTNTRTHKHDHKRSILRNLIDQSFNADCSEQHPEQYSLCKGSQAAGPTPAFHQTASVHSNRKHY